MFAIIKDNQIVKTSGSIRSLFPNISFPASGPSEQFKAENGIVEVVDGEQKDQRFYWVTPSNPHIVLVDGIPTRTYINTPKNLEQLKIQWIATVKDTANKKLLATDWYVIRKAERNIEIPENVVIERTNIITETEATEAAIRSCTTVEELIEAHNRSKL
jgi:predicted metallo-beta-lactamase superfamily hydrolase